MLAMKTNPIDIDQFYELKEYFRDIITPFYTEWNDIPYPEKCEAVAIFVKCVGDDLIDYVDITKEIQNNIYKLFNSELQYKENKTHEDRLKQQDLHLRVSVPFTLEILKNIHSHIVKIFYECTPSDSQQEKIRRI